MSFELPSIRDIEELLDQLCRATGNFKQGHNDLERIAALKAARRLVQALEKPYDMALMTGSSVHCFLKNGTWKIDLTS
jgi:hypothetical protein